MSNDIEVHEFGKTNIKFVGPILFHTNHALKLPLLTKEFMAFQTRYR